MKLPLKPPQICITVAILFLIIYIYALQREPFSENIYQKNKLGKNVIHGSAVYFDNPYPTALQQGYLSSIQL